MKIEKVNDHQIRCTLTKADLADRQLKLSELAYGTEKAKDLFRDMMQQASAKFGFEAEDIPLMIEAIPLSGDCIVLIITKVEDPEELDTRFSKFAPSLHDGEDGTEELAGDLRAEDEVLDLFRRVQKSRQEKEKAASDPSLPAQKKETAEEPTDTEERNFVRLFSFDSLFYLSRIACQLVSFYQGISNLYKNPDTGRYLLVINQSGQEPEDFNRLCNILSEYGQLERYSKAHEAYMAEHYELLLSQEAVQSLAMLEEASH